MQSAPRSRTRSQVWSNYDDPKPHATDIDSLTVNHHRSATTLAHGGIVDRVLNCEHDLTTLIGFLFLNLFDYYCSVTRIRRPAVPRNFDPSSHTCNKLCPLPVCRTFRPCLCSCLHLGLCPMLLPVLSRRGGRCPSDMLQSPATLSWLRF